MASIVAPATPGNQVTWQTDSPGTWTHPKFSEITRRQAAAKFDDSNLTRISWNGGALLFLWTLGHIAMSSRLTRVSLVDPMYETFGLWATIVKIAIYLIPLYNIFVALYPLFKIKDDIIDIPLTPTQRSLMGLDPKATPPVTPGIKYVTPPRYPRSATPQSGTPGSQSASNAGSPFSRKGSPLPRQSSDSQFPPSGSPLLGKGSIGPMGSKETRRNSSGLPSLLHSGSNSKDMGIFGTSNTPSPSRGGPGVSLNSRWLYERGRSSSGSRSLYS